MLLGCEKLSISADGCKVVLEEDGSEIEDDEILQEYVGSTVMILQQNENWLSASEQNKVAQSAKQMRTEKGTGNYISVMRDSIT